MSKADGQDNKPPLTAEQQKKADAVVAFQAEWARVGKDIIEGKLEDKDLKITAETLLKHRRDAGVDADTAVKNIIKDCKAANISDTNLHKFTGAAIAAEFEFEKKDPVNEGLMRFSSKSVAKSLLDYEMDKMGFKPISLDLAKRGTDKEVVDALIDVKIPQFLKDHYTPIVKHYQNLDEEDRKNERPNTMRVQRAYTNLVFSTVTSPLSAENMEKYNEVKAKLGDKHPDSEKERVEMARIQTKISQLAAIAYPGPTKQASADDKAVMYDALAKQFDPDPTKQQLDKSEIQKLKESAYKRGNVAPDTVQASSVKPQTPEKLQVPQKETKAETANKSLADRFHDVKEKVSHEVGKVSEQVEAKASTVVKDIKIAGKDAFKQAETQVHTAIKDVKTSAANLTDNVAHAVDVASKSFGTVRNTVDIATKDNPAEKPRFSLSGKATKTAVGAIRDELVRRQHEEHHAKSQQEQNARSNPSQGHPPARPGSKPPLRPGQHDGGISH